MRLKFCFATDRGAAIDVADASGRTPLHYAAGGGHVESVGKLIIAGAGVGLQDAQGYTPAHLAAMHGHAEVRRPHMIASILPRHP